MGSINGMATSGGSTLIHWEGDTKHGGIPLPGSDLGKSHLTSQSCGGMCVPGGGWLK